MTVLRIILGLIQSMLDLNLKSMSEILLLYKHKLISFVSFASIRYNQIKYFVLLGIEQIENDYQYLHVFNAW